MFTNYAATYSEQNSTAHGLGAEKGYHMSSYENQTGILNEIEAKDMEWQH